MCVRAAPVPLTGECQSAVQQVKHPLLLCFKYSQTEVGIGQGRLCEKERRDWGGGL